MYIVTTALPYANGDIHLGHILEHIQADIYVRRLRQSYKDVYFCGADDSHGTAIVLAAEKEGIDPKELIKRSMKRHYEDISGFGVEYDNYYTTHSEENLELVKYAYSKLVSNDLIEKRTIQQLYDSEKEMFLPDRFVKGECPKCHSQEQYGDNCDSCGATYEAYELIDPKSVLTGATPVLKETEHLFLKTRRKRKFLRDWSLLGLGVRMNKSAEARFAEWVGDGEANLKDWCISRDAPYFGFKIPNEENKYFYVWMDAPFGYFASYKNLCDKGGAEAYNFDGSRKDVQLIHFIGKDILRFHTVFWPIVLDAAGMTLPNKIISHGFITVNGEKMSKSKGTFITARKYLDSGIDPELLRYYLASKMNNNERDINFDIEDFVNSVNNELIGKIINIPSRLASVINKAYGGRILNPLSYESMIDDPFQFSCLRSIENIQMLISSCNYANAVSNALKFADKINARVEELKIWEAMSEDCSDSRKESLHDHCSEMLILMLLLFKALSPIMPKLYNRVLEFMNISNPKAPYKEIPEDGHYINAYEHLHKRLVLSEVKAKLLD